MAQVSHAEGAGAPDWLAPALDYAGAWLAFQAERAGIPGVAFAAAHQGRLAGEGAWGHADLNAGEALTPRHRFRVASHSKTFTAVGIMRLAEAGALALDDPASKFVDGLHAEVGAATLAQLLSHSAGLIRDGLDGGQFADLRPFLSEPELRAALAEAPILPAGTRFKYSNHGFGLLGLVTEAVTGRPWRDWMAEEVVAAAGLDETSPDFEPASPLPFARGHTPAYPAGRRLTVPADNSTAAMASATGFVSTAADLARFFGRLDPSAPDGVISPESRRTMIAPRLPDPDTPRARAYGLGLMLADAAGQPFFGHSGGFQGVKSQTAALPGLGVSVSVIINASDGPADPWLTGLVHILAHFAAHGAPSAAARDWNGRWWALGGATDLVAVGDKVHAVNPLALPPFAERSEIRLTGPDAGVVDHAPGLEKFGETVARLREAGEVAAVRIGGVRMTSEAESAALLHRLYG